MSEDEGYPILVVFLILFGVLLFTSKTCMKIMEHLEREKDIFFKNLFSLDEIYLEKERKESEKHKKKKKKEAEESDSEDEEEDEYPPEPAIVLRDKPPCDKLIQVNPIDFMLVNVEEQFRPYYVPNTRLHNSSLLYLHGITMKKQSGMQTDPVTINGMNSVVANDRSTFQVIEDSKPRKSKSLQNSRKKRRRRKNLLKRKHSKNDVSLRPSKSTENLSLSLSSTTSNPLRKKHHRKLTKHLNLYPPSQEPSVCSGDFNLMEYISRPLQYLFDHRVREFESFEQWPLKKSQVLKNSSKFQKVEFPMKSMSRFPFHLLELKSVTHMDFSRNLFTFIPRWFFQNLKDLTKINLSYNYLYDFPEEVKNCPNLKEINLSHNRIQYFPNIIIQEAMRRSSFKNLSVLNLSHNQITVLPYNIFKLRSLTSFDMSNNVLIYLPVSILKMRGNLKQLNVKNNLFMYEVQSTIIDKFSVSVRQLSPDDGIGTGIRGGEYFSYSQPRSARERANNFTSLRPPEYTEKLKLSQAKKNSGKGKSKQVKAPNEKQSIPVGIGGGGGERKEELVHEIVANELSYLNMLNVFHKLYFHPLIKDFKDTRKRYNLYEMTERQKSLLIPEEIQEIIKFERKFFCDMKREFERYRGREIILVNICKIFDRNMKDLERVYVNYPFIFQISRISITKLRSKLKDLRKFLERKQKLPMSNGYRLEDFLSLPLNRLHIYHSFLQRYYKCISEEEKEMAKKTINNMKSLYNSGKEVIFRMNNKFRMEEIQSRLKMKKLYNEKRILKREGDLLLSPTKEVSVFKKKLAKSINWDVGGTISNTASLLKGQVNSVFEKNAGQVVRGIFNTRLLEYYVHVYLFNDRMIWEYNNIWTSSFYRLLGKVHNRNLSELKKLEPNMKEASFTLLFEKSSKKDKYIHEISFVAQNEEQALLWTEAIQDCMMQYQKDHPEEFENKEKEEEEEEEDGEEDKDDEEEEEEEEEEELKFQSYSSQTDEDSEEIKKNKIFEEDVQSQSEGEVIRIVE